MLHLKLLTNKVRIRVQVSFILSLTSFSIIAQSHIGGKIIDKDTKVPISYCNLMLNKTNIGTVADSSGRYILQFPNQFDNGSIYFTCLGYHDTIISINRISEIVELRAKPFKLKEILVYPNNLTEERIGSKKHFLSFNGLSVNCTTGEGFRLYFPFKQNSALKSVEFNYTSLPKAKMSFHLRLLEADTSLKTLRDDLLEEYITVTPTKKGWCKVDLSKFNLAFPKKGLIIEISVIGELPNYNDKDALRKLPRIGFLYTKKGQGYIWMSHSIKDSAELMGYIPAAILNVIMR